MLFALFLLPILIVPIGILIVLARLDTGASGLFLQERIGQYGKPFKIYKIRSLKQGVHRLGHMDYHATSFGGFIRVHKLDELPQLFNVIKGEMSFVGPRPDLPGFADTLEGEDRIILDIKPGITGPATLKYKDEELILAKQLDPENYNRTVIWKDKVEINKRYVKNYSFSLDLHILLKSIKNA
ncbi:lipopolysaccharide/colanic/teichoic acid biosynthesis glycosyltransferase [Gelidibacter sediminis]|uniref:Lipopolysaccharide/colanic/teichoic acid biosynthesis glycosyltransferase n=1 Tax=Gelidibacter sediminis TaxID=1608710 RepID=A0A4R7PKQ1_9FLAO|nr:lipopolysaccharide/colanic/teichoic acid biosynthesis glycosyltransferase [Gelidibacter sediminis]